MPAKTVKRATRRRLSPAAVRRSRTQVPLDPAALILELEMAAVVREAAPRLRRRADGDANGRPGWWRWLFG
jgi:hypothetical protein